MFRFTPFNNNLCLWGNTLASSKLPSSRLASMFASTNCPVKTSPSFADSPTGPLCHVCPAWRWGTTCFAEDGGALYDLVDVRFVLFRPASRLPFTSIVPPHPECADPLFRRTSTLSRSSQRTPRSLHTLSRSSMDIRLLPGA
jgi:hypothetical protein